MNKSIVIKFNNYRFKCNEEHECGEFIINRFGGSFTAYYSGSNTTETRFWTNQTSVARGVCDHFKVKGKAC